MNQISLKDDFKEQVKKWVILDTQLKMVQEKVKIMRDEKNVLGTKICNHLEKSGNAHRKIMIHDGNLKMYEKKEYSPLTFSFLEQHLGKIMTDPEQVDFVIQYLKEQREIKTTPDIRRNYKEMNN